MKVLVLVFSVLFLTNCAHLCNMKVKNNVVDNQGRIVIYHGLNVANTAKHDALRGYMPWQTKEDFKRLNDWGFNIVRLLVFWHAEEPLQGIHNTAYFDSLIVRIKYLNSIGVDVVIDCMQGLYGPATGGSGYPEWTTNTGGYKYEERTPWTLMQLEPAILYAYNTSWQDSNLVNGWVNWVGRCYKAFDTLPNVVGFDVMNEPFPTMPIDAEKLIKLEGEGEPNINLGNLGTLKCVADSFVKFETKTLPAFYAKVQTMIDANKFKKPIWMEPAIWTSSGVPSILKYKPSKGTVFFPHYYDIKVHASKHNKTIAAIMKEEIAATVINANRFGTPALFGEFGAPMQAPGYLDYLNDFLALTDSKNIGWTYYTYDKGHPFGVLDVNGVETPHMTKLVRVYPQRIAGVDPKYGIVGNKFTLTYNHTLDAATEVFIPSNLKVTVNVNGVNIPYTQGLFSWNKKGKTTLTVEW